MLLGGWGQTGKPTARVTARGFGKPKWVGGPLPGGEMSSLSLEGGGTGCRGKGGEGSLRGCPAWQGSRSWVGGRRSSQSCAYCLMVKKQQGIVEWEKSRRERTKFLT